MGRLNNKLLNSESAKKSKIKKYYQTNENGKTKYRNLWGIGISSRKEITKIRAEINERETRNIIEKITKTKSWFFKRQTKIDKPLARLIKKNRGLKENCKCVSSFN